VRGIILVDTNCEFIFNMYVSNAKYKNGLFFYSQILYQTPNWPHVISQELKSLMEGLLKKEPQGRLGGTCGAYEIKTHKFFKVSSFYISVIVQ
jgi:hypothetical protein